MAQRYKDLRQQLADLDRHGLLQRVSRPINKDTELHPLVRVQFVSELPECERKAWLFEAPTDAHGTTYTMPVAVGALAASRGIYAHGLSLPPDDLDALWGEALRRRI